MVSASKKERLSICSRQAESCPGNANLLVALAMAQMPCFERKTIGWPFKVLRFTSQGNSFTQVYRKPTIVIKCRVYRTAANVWLLPAQPLYRSSENFQVNHFLKEIHGSMIFTGNVFSSTIKR